MIALLCDVSRGMHMGKRSELAFLMSSPKFAYLISWSYALLCSAMICFALLCFALLGYALLLLCFALLCFALLRFALL